LTDVIDTYEYSQIYMLSKYINGNFGKYEKYTSESTATGSVKSANKFVKYTPTQVHKMHL